MKVIPKKTRSKKFTQSFTEDKGFRNKGFSPGLCTFSCSYDIRLKLHYRNSNHQVKVMQ